MKTACSHGSRLGAAVLLFCLCASGGAGTAEPPSTLSNASTGSGDASTTDAGMAGTFRPAAPLPNVCEGFEVRVYSQVAEPMKLAFGRDGALYVGRQPGARIHEVARRGREVVEFGPPMVDPDAVLVDSRGAIGGVRHSVLVGGGGIIAAIFPDQTSRVIFNTGFADVDDMQFDRKGRLIFSDDVPQVLVTTGRSPTVLFSLPSRPGSIAIDDDNRIFVALADGTIRIYNSDGTLADSAFASGLAGLDTYLAFGPRPGPGRFSRALYVLNGSELLYFGRRGHATRIGSGFTVGPSSGTGFVFGPDRALYVSDYANNRILRVSSGHGGRGEACSIR